MEISFGGFAFAFVVISQFLAVVAARAAIATPSDCGPRKAADRSVKAGSLGPPRHDDRIAAARWIKQTS
jgi:hypothetical protein